MNFTRRQFLRLTAAIAASPAASRVASGQNLFPSRYVRLVVPFAAGGGGDAIGKTAGKQVVRDVGRRDGG